MAGAAKTGLLLLFARQKHRKTHGFGNVGPLISDSLCANQEKGSILHFGSTKKALFRDFLVRPWWSPKAGGKKKHGYANFKAYRCVDAWSVYTTVCSGISVTLVFFAACFGVVASGGGTPRDAVCLCIIIFFGENFF